MTEVSQKSAARLLKQDRKLSFAARRYQNELAEQAKVQQALLSLPALQAFFPSDPSHFQNPPPFFKVLQEKIEGGKTLRQAFDSLANHEKEAFRSRMDGQALRTFFSISENSDRRRFWNGLVRLGRGLKREGKIDEALGVFAYLSGEGGPISSEIRKKAQREFDAMVGKGSTSARLEFLASQFIKDATDYKMIVPMIAGSAVYQLVRTTAMARLATATRPLWYSRGIGARLVSGGIGFAAEVPTFSLLSQGLRHAAGEPVGPMGRELGGAALTLGLLKTTGFLGRQAFRKLHGVGEAGQVTRLKGLSQTSQFLLPQTAMFTGLLTSHNVEQWIGWRPRVDGATTVADTLASLVSLGVGAHLGHRALGPGFAKFQQRLGLSAQLYGQYAHRKNNLLPLLLERLSKIFPKPKQGIGLNKAKTKPQFWQEVFPPSIFKFWAQPSLGTSRLHSFAAPALMGMDIFSNGHPTLTGLALTSLGVLAMAVKKSGGPTINYDLLPEDRRPNWNAVKNRIKDIKASGPDLESDSKRLLRNVEKGTQSKKISPEDVHQILDAYEENLYQEGKDFISLDWQIRIGGRVQYFNTDILVLSPPAKDPKTTESYRYQNRIELKLHKIEGSKPLAKARGKAMEIHARLLAPDQSMTQWERNHAGYFLLKILTRLRDFPDPPQLLWVLGAALDHELPYHEVNRRMESLLSEPPVKEIEESPPKEIDYEILPVDRRPTRAAADKRIETLLTCTVPISGRGKFYIRKHIAGLAPEDIHQILDAYEQALYDGDRQGQHLIRLRKAKVQGLTTIFDPTLWALTPSSLKTSGESFRFQNRLAEIIASLGDKEGGERKVYLKASEILSRLSGPKTPETQWERDHAGFHLDKIMDAYLKGRSVEHSLRLLKTLSAALDHRLPYYDMLELSLSLRSAELVKKRKEASEPPQKKDPFQDNGVPSSKIPKSKIDPMVSLAQRFNSETEAWQESSAKVEELRRRCQDKEGDLFLLDSVLELAVELKLNSKLFHTLLDIFEGDLQRGNMKRITRLLDDEENPQYYLESLTFKK